MSAKKYPPGVHKSATAGKWLARWKTPDGKNHRRTFASYDECVYFAGKMRTQIREGDYIDRDAGKVSFMQAAEAWRLSTADHSIGTQAAVESRLRLHVYPTIGDKPLNKLTQHDIERAVAAMRESGLSATTIETTMRHVRTVLNRAVRRGHLRTSPAVDVRVPEPERPELEPLEIRHVQRLATAVPDRYRALVIVMANTGMRPGEAFGLTVDNVTRDPMDGRDNGVVQVRRQLVTTKGGTGFAALKTPKSNRNIPIPDWVLREVDEQVETFGCSDDGLVFTGPKNEPIRRNRASEIWRRAIGGLEDWPADARGWHALRHHYASVLIASGASVPIVQRRLGHKSARQTLDVYAHIFEAAEDETRKALERAWSV